MSNNDQWMESESEIERATGPAASALLSALSETLAKAPPEKRYTVTVEVEEHE